MSRTNIPKKSLLYRDSGKGKNAIIYLESVGYNKILKNKNTALQYALYAYYNHLNNYGNYDNVYILSNNVDFTKNVIDIIDERSILYPIRDKIINNCAEKNLFLNLVISDIYIGHIHINFFGGVVEPYRLSFFARMHEWFYNTTNDKKIFSIIDDPMYTLTNPTVSILKRLYEVKTIKPIYSDNNEVNKIIQNDIDYVGENLDNVFKIFNEVYVSFCGIDYNYFLNNLKTIDLPTNVIGWDSLEAYIWSGVNDFLEYKFADYNFSDKEYDCSYVGMSKDITRTITTERYYRRLKNKFLHFYVKKPFFMSLLPNEDYDSMQKIFYPEIYEEMCKHSKSTFVTHTITNLGNQISPRFFDDMISDIICFLDINYDEDYDLVDNEELREFMYVSSPKEFSEKVDRISNDEDFYKHIKYLQRLEVWNKFNEYIEEKNKQIWKNKLDIS